MRHTAFPEGSADELRADSIFRIKTVRIAENGIK